VRVEVLSIVSMVKDITSRSNDVIRRLRRLRRRSFRDLNGVFMIEGTRLLREAVIAGARFKEVGWIDCREPEATDLCAGLGYTVESYRISDQLMEWVTDVVASQGILAVVEMVDGRIDEFDVECGLFLVADMVRDPGNMGALLRIADASGVDGFIATGGSVDLYNPKVVRAASGAHFHVQMARDVPLKVVRARMGEIGVRLLGLNTRDGESYLEKDMTVPVALVCGNEAFGLPEDDLDLIEEKVCIEMPGKAESLNVASAAAVVAFEAIRQRRVGRTGIDDS
jgi:RNA methyltransferase, TrmH family